jgi:hypothetical protein
MLCKAKPQLPMLLSCQACQGYEAGFVSAVLHVSLITHDARDLLQAC